MEFIKEFSKQGIKVIEKLDEKTLSNMILVSNKKYYNEEQIISDSQYDILKEFIEKKFPENIAIKMIGAPVNKKKVKLPYEMWSMDKIKPDTKELDRWLEKYKDNKVISGKLDGVSGLYSTEDGIPKLYTRGNGKVGQDISHIIPFLQLPTEKGIVIRGELIIDKNIFSKIYKTKAANARSFVSGTINLKKPDPSRYMDIDFVAYEVIKPVLSPSKQLQWLENNDINTVINIFREEVSNEFLSKLLMMLRTDYRYEIDGIIVSNDKIYPRTSKNPSHAFAFKMVLTEQEAEAKVLDVKWTPSKDGLLKPRVQFERVIINGVNLQFASGYNAKFIFENKIGIGSIIKVIRSGDVIPKIIDVIVEAEPKMPNIPWEWNETEVEAAILDTDSCEIVREKKITEFFVKLEVEGLGVGNIKKMIESGFDTIKKILEMDTQDFLSCEGFQEKKAKKIYKNIKKQVKECSLARLMGASNLMGRGMGERRSKMVLESIPDILISKKSTEEKIQLVQEIDGFAEKTAELFVKQIPKFMEFVCENNLEYKLKIKKTNKNSINHPLNGKSIVFTGFRPSKELKEKLYNITGKGLGNSVNSKTFAIITKDLNKKSVKIKKGEELKIPIFSLEGFIIQYNL
jgi:NAD-dependent DNA ligase